MSDILKTIAESAEDARNAYRMAGEEPELPLKPYKWIVIAGGLVRPQCRKHQLVMKWAMKMSKDYPPSINKHTRSHHAFPVEYMGLPIQIYKCPYEGCEVEAVK